MDSLPFILRRRQFEDEDDDQGPPQLRSLRALRSARGGNWRDLAVAKFVQYAILGAPVGIAVGKFLDYVILGPPAGVSVAKFVQYVVLQDVQRQLLGGPPDLLRKLLLRRAGEDEDETRSLRALRRTREFRPLPGFLPVDPAYAQRLRQLRQAPDEDETLSLRALRRGGPPINLGRSYVQRPKFL